MGLTMSEGSAGAEAVEVRAVGAALARAAAATTPWLRSASIALTGVRGPAAADSPGNWEGTG